ncbi:hypothetical protein [Lactiplantibacillus plantarum]|uniref:hypothetical protein n=1 Tax=Lactiplantibacillus plantarum TaxID=1590 RepID=UPI003C1CF784
MANQQFKVAKIIDDTTLVINAGENKGIEVGNSFQIIGKFGTEPVIDPDTKENLGTLDDIKGTVIAKKVYPNMTVCKSKFINEKVNMGTLASTAHSPLATLRDLQAGIISTGHYEQLNVDKKQITGGFKESNTPIEIGDIAQLQ